MSQPSLSTLWLALALEAAKIMCLRGDRPADRREANMMELVRAIARVR